MSNQVNDTPQMYHQPMYRDDEINLGELLRNIGREWKVISAITLMITGLAVLYALQATPVFEVKSFISRPHVNDLQPLNENGLDPISTNRAFGLFIGNLNSQALLRQYFDDQNYVSNLNEEWQDLDDFEIDNAYFNFLENFSIELPESVTQEDEENQPRISYGVSLFTDDSAAAAEFINGYISFAEQETLNLIYEEQLARKNVQVSKIERKMDALLSQAETDRQNRIILLQDSIAIAEAVGIEDPFTLQQALVSSQAFEKATGNLSVTDQMMLLSSARGTSQVESTLPADEATFLSGTKLLEAELTQLEARKNDLPYVAALSNYRLQLTELNQFSLDFTGAKLLKVELPAFASTTPVKPNKKLIVAGGFVGSLFLALIIALVKIAIRQEEKV